MDPMGYIVILHPICWATFAPPLLGAFQVANDSGGAPPEPFDSTVPEAIHYLLTRATWQKTVIM